VLFFGRAFIQGARLRAVSGPLLLELAVGIAYLLFEYLLFVRFERRAKRIGSLETVK